MKISIPFVAVVVLAMALSLAALHWFFRGELSVFKPNAVPGSVIMAAYLDEAVELIVREEGLDRNAYCLRVPVWQQQYDDGCALVRMSLTAQSRQCTPYRALNGDCYAIEMRQSLLQNRRIRDLLFTRAADICLYTMNPSPRTVRGAHSIDCVSPGGEYEMVNRIEPMLCVFALDADEEAAAPAIAIRRGRQVQDYWCHEWEKLVRVRSRAKPQDRWLGVERSAPGGGRFAGCIPD